jgi:site-specific DNA-methyltransferase (adenine-specific)
MIKPYFVHGTTTLYCEEFPRVMAEMVPGNFAAVITDPPYPKEYLSLWEPLAWHSERLLIPGGSLLAITPHYALPEILDTVGRKLKFRWLLSMDQSHGPHPRMAMGIEVAWKPVGWWVKGSWPAGRGFICDRFESRGEQANAKLHKWQQSIDWADAMLRFVPVGGVVLDPMAGSGTLLVAAAQRGISAVGIDSDEAACEIAAQRIREQT